MTADFGYAETNPLAPLPHEVADRLRPHFDSMVDMVVRRIQEKVPEYARPGNRTYLTNTREAVEEGFEGFLARIGVTAPADDGFRERFRTLGAGEAHEGRSLDSLQVAMRTAVVLMWRRISEVQMAEPDVFPQRYVGPVAEALFLFLEELAGAATEGYNQAQVQVAGEVRRRRGRLVDLLLSEAGPASEAVAEMALAADWRPPAAVAVVVLGGRDVETAPPAALPSDVLSDFNRIEPRLIVPDPDGPGRMRTLGTALRGWHVAVGPTVSVTEAPSSLARARETLSLVNAGIIPGKQIVRWADHLITALLFRDEELMREMVARRLAPLIELRSVQRERLAETLLAWLQCGFNAKQVAQKLHVHPQTVRYRLRQLEELFGARLFSADCRFELEAALRVRVLTGWEESEPRTGDSTGPVG
ncbi:helix-turn-helix domain-containing protein [Nocardiopsis exhalans]|uniref:Helix-turn-helix domain-containing protein n=1 Tax=Nocardiopsis exhalans TaxID=163604 RepID=A0ABY5D5Q3_9ACTN|nr:PucR family transcriptional regulator [Nocardiopsis exhalans]USY18476.1 helix-turn-helix domain-containing protein [Nocardiopsis exhalans]